MRLRYAGTCRVCAADLPAGAPAIYGRSTKTVRCVECAPPPVVAEVLDPGVPGASARREYERRRTKREEQVRTRHPHLAKLILAVTDDPQSTRAWDTGALGEEALGTGLNKLSSSRVRVMHDRRIPGTRANIDHLVVGHAGVWVIDAKRYQGRPTLRVEGGLLRPRVEKLLVGRRNCTKVVDGVLKQVDVVRGVVDDDVPVHGALCFVDADWPLIGGAFTTRGVAVLWPKKLYPRLQEPGPLSLDDIDRLHRALARALPPA